MKKLLIIIASLDRNGGAEKTAYGLQELQDEFSVSYLTFYRTGNEYRPDNQVHCLNEQPTSSLFGKVEKLYSRAIAIRQICHTEGIDVCLSFMEESSIPLLFSRLFGNRARIAISIRNNLRAKYNILTILILSSFYLLSDRIIGVSQFIIDQLAFSRLLRKRYVTIHNFIDRKTIGEQSSVLPDEWPAHANRTHVITVGRLHPQKRQQLLLEAVALATTPLEVGIIGEGVLRQVLEQHINDASLQDHVTLLGRRVNVYQYMKHADIFVLTSEYEGFPNVVIEALACGLPVIATDCPFGVREILAPGQLSRLNDTAIEQAPYGIMIRRNDAHALVEAIEFLANDASRREHYRKQALKRATEFDRPAIMNQWRQLVTELTTSR